MSTCFIKSCDSIGRLFDSRRGARETWLKSARVLRFSGVTACDLKCNLHQISHCQSQLTVKLGVSWGGTVLLNIFKLVCSYLFLQIGNQLTFRYPKVYLAHFMLCRLRHSEDSFAAFFRLWAAVYPMMMRPRLGCPRRQ
jgi:hypothetical protein